MLKQRNRPTTWPTNPKSHQTILAHYINSRLVFTTSILLASSHLAMHHAESQRVQALPSKHTSSTHHLTDHDREKDDSLTSCLFPATARPHSAARKMTSPRFKTTPTQAAQPESVLGLTTTSKVFRISPFNNACFPRNLPSFSQANGLMPPTTCYPEQTNESKIQTTSRKPILSGYQ
jgi:hypothetical protein